MKTAILDALEARYEAQIAEADATVKIYLENSVGIGEHPQHLEEMDKLVDRPKTIDDCILPSSLKKLFSSNKINQFTFTSKNFSFDKKKILSIKKKKSYIDILKTFKIF